MAVEFAELCAKTNYSFLEGASHPEEMVETAHRMGISAIGITDKNGVYGVPRAHSAGKSLGLPILIGAEILLAPAQSVTLLAKNRKGYGDLCELLTDSQKTRDPKRRSLPCITSLSHLKEKSADLFCLLPALQAEKWIAGQLKESFEERFFLIASRFHEGGNSLSCDAAELLSREFNAKCIASNQPLLHDPSRKPLQDVLTCIRHTCTLKEAGFRLLPNLERHLKNGETMLRLFPDHPDWLVNTKQIASQCTFSLDEIRYHYPTEWIPQGETGDSYLAKLSWEGATRRYGNQLQPGVRKQLEHELNLIRDLQYSDYFLTIWDIVQFANKKEILCQGRGSAANSIVCYVLGITAIDPIRMGLLFERFISRERKEPPDIDIDFEHERREEVIQYIYGRYGRHRAAITAEVICFRRKSALRETAKVFDISLEDVEKWLTLTYRRKLGEVPLEEIQKSTPKVSIDLLKKCLTLTNELLSFPRHLGTHVGGFVLCHDPLNRNVPIEPTAMPDRTIVQWDKNDLDALGFVRVDILGLGILTCLRKCFALVKEFHGKSLSLADVPAEDAAVYEAMCRADTVGTFQIESRAQMNMLPRLKPRNFFDLVVEISLVRPGPIQGEMVHPYLRRRTGKEKIEYAHPLLEAILQKTYGVPLFQEQIMKMAMQVAGFSGGEADALRRAMGSWRRDGKGRLTLLGEKFRDGLLAQGIALEFANRIFTQIQGFAEYGFPESHAASFAIIAYCSVYLKHYYPDAYLTAILNSQPMGFYSPHTLIHDAERHGVRVKGIDINHSLWDNRMEKKGIVRLGFREIKGFAEQTGLAMEKARGELPFSSFYEFVHRLQEALRPQCLTKRDLFLLAGADAFQSLKIGRREALWEIQALLLHDSQSFSPTENPVDLPPEREWEKISLDYEAMGLSIDRHPMAFLRDSLKQSKVLASCELDKAKEKSRVRVAGMVVSRQMPPTASGVLFITLEDEYGFTNLVVWKSVYEQNRDVLLTQSFLLCGGKIQRAEDGNVIHVIVDSAEPLLGPGEAAYPLPSHDFH